MIEAIFLILGLIALSACILFAIYNQIELNKINKNLEVIRESSELFGKASNIYDSSLNSGDVSELIEYLDELEVIKNEFLTLTEEVRANDEVKEHIEEKAEWVEDCQKLLRKIKNRVK